MFLTLDQLKQDANVIVNLLIKIQDPWPVIYNSVK